MTFRNVMRIVVGVLNIAAIAYFAWIVYQEVHLAIYQPGLLPYNELAVNVSCIAIVIFMLSAIVTLRRNK